MSINVGDLLSLPPSASTLGSPSPLHGRESQRDIRDPRVHASVGTLSDSLSATPPPGRLAIFLVPLCVSWTAVCPRLGGSLRIPQPPDVFFWTHILFSHTKDQKLPRERVFERYNPPLPLDVPSRTGPRQLHVVCHNEIV